MLLNVVLNQVKSQINDKNKNIKQLLNTIKKYQNNKPTVIVFPELYVSGYMVNERTETVAEPVPGPTTNKVSEEIKTDKTVVLFGLPEKGEKGKLYNTAVAVSKGGVICRYRKISLPNFWIFNEGKFFTPGDRVAVFQFQNVKFGVQICYDINFPVISRNLTFGGAQVLVVLSATPTRSIPRFNTLLKARAVENQAYILYVNKVGDENGVKFGGNSQVISPNGEELINLGEKEETKQLQIDISEGEELRSNVPLIRDGVKIFKHFKNRIFH